MITNHFKEHTNIVQAHRLSGIPAADLEEWMVLTARKLHDEGMAVHAFSLNFLKSGESWNTSWNIHVADMTQTAAELPEALGELRDRMAHSPADKAAILRRESKRLAEEAEAYEKVASRLGSNGRGTP